MIWRKIYKNPILIALSLILLYGLTRLLNLTILPIFTDEAIYIRWSQIGSRDASWRFISLVDGKQPMFTWIMMIFFKIFHGDPLITGRLVSVVSGSLSAVGLWFLSWELFKSRRIAYFVSFLYIICPFTLMYDRLAVYDSLVAAFSIWSLYMEILLVRTLRLDVALILALVLGGGMLNKSSGFISLYLMPATLLLLPIDQYLWRNIKRWILLTVLVIILSQIYYSILRLSPLFNMIALKNTVFIYPIHDWLKHPLTFFVGNIRGLWDWMVGYLTWPILLSAILSLFAVWSNLRKKIVLFIWSIAPLIGLALFGKVLYPRFILFMMMPLLILAGLTVDRIYRSLGRYLIGIVLLIVIILPSTSISYFIIKNPVEARIPMSDSGQLINDWPAGGGVKEVNQFLKIKSKTGKLVVYTEGTFGLMPYALEMYAVDNPNIEIHGLWPLPINMPISIQTSAKSYPTYIILNQTQIVPSGWPMKLIGQYQKGNRPDRALRLFEVTLPIADNPPNHLVSL
jgi:4-amino-4-deoxy-L-arabinose transferase-like glycosyltransferase